ncbi:MAG: hypothetical protein J6L75_07415 [Alistipes sp.]|nr:hypothetical protein [Alistipes sp.]
MIYFQSTGQIHTLYKKATQSYENNPLYQNLPTLFNSQINKTNSFSQQIDYSLQPQIVKPSISHRFRAKHHSTRNKKKRPAKTERS